MKKILTTFFVLVFFNVQAVVYDSLEIKRELAHPELQTKSQNYLTRYFTEKNSDKVIDDLVKADLLPIQKEYILYQLLTEISQQPPQDFFQGFVDRMKKYPIEAKKTALEGPLPLPIFNINSRAYGIENIWLAYRTEQRFNQLFNKSIPQAVNAIADAIAEQSRPQWLGIKNSIEALNENQKKQLLKYLSDATKVNAGLDKLISHVGLIMADESLIRKALLSNQQAIREYTLRKAGQHLSEESTKELLLQAADGSQDQKLSVSLLHQFSDDKVIDFLIKQLSNKQLAESAAFSLSQSSDINLPQQLLQKYHQSSSETEKNHILLALRLNKSDAAKLATEDIKATLSGNTKQSQWLKSFEGATQ